MKRFATSLLMLGALIAMPFAFIGFFLAVQTTDAVPEWPLLLKVVLCMVFARNAAMAFNLADLAAAQRAPP